MKLEFEKNITVMKTLSYIFIGTLKFYIDYSRELGINLPFGMFVSFTLFPVLYIFVYPLFKLVKRKTRKHESYYMYLNDLTIISFILLGVFFCILITQQFWHNLGILLLMITVMIVILVSCALIVFFSLLITWLYVNFTAAGRRWSEIN